MVKPLGGFAVLLLACLFGRPSQAETVSPSAELGDTPAEVLAKMGKPMGSVVRGRLTIFYYDRGMVDFLDGHVKSAFLISAEEAARQRLAREKAEAAERAAAEARRQALSEEGRQQLTRCLADKTLDSKPAAERVAFWQDFAKRYPFTDVSAELSKAETALQGDARKADAAAELRRIADRTTAIQARLKQLDEDYAASLANWKRNEIDAERRKLDEEKNDILGRLTALQASSAGATVTKSE